VRPDYTHQGATGTGFVGRSEKGRAQLGKLRGATPQAKLPSPAPSSGSPPTNCPTAAGISTIALAPATAAALTPAISPTATRVATAMALLPFLGAGQTHREGKYQEVVRRGLYFLTSQLKTENHGGLATGNLAQGGGQLYSHGLAPSSSAKPTA